MVPKILLTTGCSYGKFADAFLDNEFNSKFSNLELVIDLHSMSLGSNFQMMSVIETTEKLLSLGVNTEDIFVLCEFSEIDRKDVVIQNDFLVNEIDKIIFNEKVNGKIWVHPPIDYPDRVVINNSQFANNLMDKLVVKKIFPNDYAKFNNYYIINPERRYQPPLPNKIVYSIIQNYVNSLSIDVPIMGMHTIDRISIESIDRGIRYFQNILTTEQYLKSKGIKYKFCLINNQFSMYNGSGLQDYKKTKVIDGEHYLNQDYLNSKQIWEINSMIKIFYDMIDWNGWWFYENKDKNIIWGGIDEFAIDKYGIKVYGSRNSDENLFGQHPNRIVYQDLIVNHLMKEYF